MKLSFQTQVENLEHEIEEKRKQMRVLEQRIVESGEVSAANASTVEMQQVSLSCQIFLCFVAFLVELAWELLFNCVLSYDRQSRR